MIRIGLMMLRDKPIHELSIDAVAGQAGISRGLLFHYFPSKRDYYVAVISAAGRRLLRVTKPDESLSPDQQLREMLTQFVAFITREYMRVHAWLAYTEDLAIEWSGLPEEDRPYSDEFLVDHAIEALHTLRKL